MHELEASLALSAGSCGCGQTHTLMSLPKQQQQHSVAILAQVVDIRRGFLRLGALSGAILCKRTRFMLSLLVFCVLDSGCRSRCRNSMSPSLEPSLEYGPAAATLAAACPRRRLRFAFSRFRLRCASGGSVALPLAGSARFLFLCRLCLRPSSCSPRLWSPALLLWFWRCRL